jgi:lysophospholipase L1-like esterase
MIINDGSTWVMIGDSITDAGRSEKGEPTPWSPQSGWGHGYANLVASHIEAIHPEKNIRVINRGISGNTVLDLKSRWQQDVLDLNPDVLSVFIGVNDVWRQCDVPLQLESHVTEELYRETYRGLLEQIAPKLQKLILIKPFIIENHKEDMMKMKIDRYGDMVSELAKEFNALLVSPQDAIDAYLEHRHSSALAWDRIHPNTTGHLLIARSLMKVLGLKMD